MGLSGRELSEERKIWLTWTGEIKEYQPHQSGVILHTVFGAVDIGIQVLAKIVDEWQKANPQIPFSLYRRTPEPPVQRSGAEEPR